MLELSLIAGLAGISLLTGISLKIVTLLFPISPELEPESPTQNSQLHESGRSI